MRTCAIVNLAAGRRRVERLWPLLLPRLREATTNLTVMKTEAPGDATRLTRKALLEGTDRIVAVGGDGTLHEVVNGYFHEDGTAVTPAPPLVPLPCGTGTDFNRVLRGKTGLEAVSYLQGTRVRPIDLLRIGYTLPDGGRAHRYAVNIASFGLSGAVVRALNRGGFHLPGPRLHYFGAIARALVSHRPVSVSLEVDGDALEPSTARVVAIGNGHTFGAGIKICPTAVVDDGIFDVTVLHHIAILRLLRSIPRFYRGDHPSLEDVSTVRGRHLTARPLGNEPVWLEADGELLGQLPATVEVAPHALRLQY